GILLMLISTAADFHTLLGGLVGSPQTLQPWTIVLFFFALAYLAISLDHTGVLEAVAKWTAVRFSSSGLHLFVAMFCLAGFITILSSNDIVILTLTPIICYICEFSQVDPVPFLFAEFFARYLFLFHSSCFPILFLAFFSKN
ncbi:MAG: SLC13 family permease, partial [archaeon]|nr:SLC13 family permease [archaeon]